MEFSFKSIFQKIKDVWNIVKREWKTHYRLVFSNEETHEQSFTIRNITIQKMVVTTIITIVVVIILTTIIIALTPLRVYIPGYTTQKDYKIYKQTAAKIDSLEQMVADNQAYIDNLSAMLAGKVPTIDEIDATDTTATTTPVTHTSIRDKKRMAETEELEEEAEMILARISEDNGNNTPSLSQAKISSISLYPPVIGSVTRPFNTSKNHYGIDIAATNHSTVTCVADGVVISASYQASDGYVIIVQHPGNLISVYKRNATLLKKTGARVTAGSPIATVGNTGSSEGKNYHLHFELWYNGFPINPLNYLVIE